MTGTGNDSMPIPQMEPLQLSGGMPQLEPSEGWVRTGVVLPFLPESWFGGKLLFLPESWKWKMAIFERYLLMEGPIFDFQNYGRKCT